MPDEKEVLKDNTDPQNPEWVLRSKIDQDIRLQVRKEYETLLAMWKEAELIELEKRNNKTIEEGLQKLFDKYMEEQKPPTVEDIQQLLDQEYQTFTLKVNYLDDNELEQSQTFTIRELPQDVEVIFYDMFTKRALGRSSELDALAQQMVDQPFEKKAKAFLKLMREGFDVLADACLLVLNPYGKKKEIDLAWVRHNISSNRQWSICEAQMQVNRLRDFFSRVSQSGQQTQTMMGNAPRFQMLQQLVRS